MAPTYLYKILDEAPPSPIPETLPSTPLDINDGFIHLSTAEQTPKTAGLFFKSHTKLWILKLKSDALDGRLEFSTDPAAGVVDGCAHVHDSQKGLGKANVVDTVLVERQEGEAWGDVAGWSKL